jgi:ribonucleoside-diphosphate reductase alpha chain
MKENKLVEMWKRIECGTIIGKRVKTTPYGEILKFIKKLYTGGYLINGESPKDAYWRVSKTVAKRLYKPELAEKFFEYIWKGWLCLASPVLSNTGTDRGLPISCFGIDVADSIQDIGNKNLEMMLLAKHGGGVGIGINQIRPAGKRITGNGTSDGVVPFCKIYDSTILATNQGSVRRGAASVLILILNTMTSSIGLKLENLKEMSIDNLLTYTSVLSLAINLCEDLKQGDQDARQRWSKLLQKRKATGEPYILI